MKKQMTREELIEDLLEMLIEGMTTSDIKELLKGSWKGFGLYTDEELIKEYWAIIGECLQEDGYTSLVIIEEAN